MLKSKILKHQIEQQETSGEKWLFNKKKKQPDKSFWVDKKRN